MDTFDAVLFGMVAGIVTLKVALLAAAAMLLMYVLTHRSRQPRVAGAPVRVKQPGLDKYAC